MSFVQCPNCHNEVSGSFLVCPSCGASLTTAQRYDKVPLPEPPVRGPGLPPASPSPKPIAAPDLAALSVVRTESTFKNGANWFYWIAALSLVNTILFRTGSSWTFIGNRVGCFRLHPVIHWVLGDLCLR